jgi:hypothetical protein
VAEPAARAASLVAGGLMVGALIHLLVGRHSPLLPFALAIALNLVSLALFTALRRPPLDAVAEAADRWFGGDALLTSALDQLRRPISLRRGGAPFVLSRAEMRASQWLPELAERAPRPGKGHAALALAGIILAGLLYSLPGAAPSPSPQPSGHPEVQRVSDLPSTGEAERTARRTAWGLEEMLPSGAARSNDSAAAGGSAFSAATADHGRAVAVAPDAAAGRVTHAAPSTGAGGPFAGTAEPRLGVSATDPDTGELIVDFVELPRRSELGEDGVGSAGLELDASRKGAPQGQAAHLAAEAIAPARPAITDARPSIPPILQHFVVSYQERIQALK